MSDDEFRMPFGKFRGSVLSDISTEYLDWLIGQDWLKPYMKQQIEDELNKRQEWHAMRDEE